MEIAKYIVEFIKENNEAIRISQKQKERLLQKNLGYLCIFSLV